MLTLTNIRKIYETKKRKRIALNDVTLKLPSKGLISILGPSGSGKSTLLNIISGNLLADSGEITYNGELITKANRDSLGKATAYIYQDYNLIEGLNVLDNLKIALKIKGREISDEGIDKLIKALGLTDLLYSYPDELSGGEQQRVAIARAILANDKILLADEVTGALDQANAKIVMDLLKEQAKDMLVILVTHDREIAKKYSDRIIEMENGEIISDVANNELDYGYESDKLVASKEGLSSYYLRLGLKYINLKSFKMYLSFIIMILAFTVMLISFSFLWFNTKDAYNSVDEPRYDYTYISKYEGDFYSRKNIPFNSADLANIEKLEANTYNMYGYASELKYNGKRVEIPYLMEASKELIKSFNLELVGSLPKAGEVLLTKNILNKLNEDDYSKITYNGKGVSGYIVSPIDSNAEVSLNDIIFMYADDVSYLTVYGLFTRKLSIDKIEALNSMKESNTFIEATNLSYDALTRADVFSSSMIKIGVPLTAFLLLISFLILVNTVYIAIDNNKNDIRIIRMLGGRMKSLFSIFSVQPIVLVLLALLLAFGVYGVVSFYINSYIIEEFNMAIALLTLTVGKIALIAGLLIVFTVISILIPIAYKKNK